MAEYEKKRKSHEGTEVLLFSANAILLPGYHGGRFSGQYVVYYFEVFDSAYFCDFSLSEYLSDSLLFLCPDFDLSKGSGRLRGKEEIKEERAASNFSTVIAEDAEERSLAETPFEPNRNIVEASEEGIKMEDSRESIPESTAESKSENTESEAENTESEAENTESEAENTELEPENREFGPQDTEIVPKDTEPASKENEQKSEGKMSFEEARRQYTDYEE